MTSHERTVDSACALPADEEIHVWQAQLDDPNCEISCLYETLTSDEQDRAARFHFERHRRRFIVARGILRILIARYIGVKAGDIRFEYSAKGKPSLAEPRVEGFSCNLSHSGDLALYAFVVGVPIGVDVEIIRPVEYMDAIAKRFFSPLEYDLLQQVSSCDRLEAFYNCWTRKEAYIKAEGLGLWIPLDSFSVSVAPSEPARLIELKSRSSDTPSWSIHHLRPATHAIGAVAVPASNRQVLLRRFS
jgi:4'-phosphopantetheinyl transferase